MHEASVGMFATGMESPAQITACVHLPHEQVSAVNESQAPRRPVFPLQVSVECRIWHVPGGWTLK
jgi:hypothetical protein